MKPDSSRKDIVAALRAAGASWVDIEPVRGGEPDGCWGYRGRMGFAEVKAPGKEHGVCGCTHSIAFLCGHPPGHQGPACDCKGHDPRRTYGERKVWHRQLAWHEAWQGPPVSVWTAVEEALATVLGQLRPAVGDRYVMEPRDEI